MEKIYEYLSQVSEDKTNDIAGYISGGAPYGVTWEEMGLNPWESLDDEQEEDVW